MHHTCHTQLLFSLHNTELTCYFISTSAHKRSYQCPPYSCRNPVIPVFSHSSGI
ncbi:uncharacterized protein LACBIDRAFT_301661 [Laccaria bicolor S238N-H82]|uniref:Predicted protein n=1 Tax=Laccaria bicolor (strain S238N-H82 / ATCC MYA-4686) TaxID=486041 RepID=B0CP05_LACBS|nr:uncharacterized protein LACBIDRAFT_301661 [Laccaria bicolor S238N-H82]EDR16028.1 predicted protein [Laccaria bicolor S238N-H82]|eukprot:XP_001874236.1 predicted protein [Laccaria bicolor S238N-H82]